jgi:hypothetical protein
LVDTAEIHRRDVLRIGCPERVGAVLNAQIADVVEIADRAGGNRRRHIVDNYRVIAEREGALNAVADAFERCGVELAG